MRDIPARPDFSKSQTVSGIVDAIKAYYLATDAWQHSEWVNAWAAQVERATIEKTVQGYDVVRTNQPNGEVVFTFTGGGSSRQWIATQC